MAPTIAPLPPEPLTGWAIFCQWTGHAAGALLFGLVLLALAGLWFALIGMRETSPRGSRPF